ncbi:hypothetical protein PF010_g32325 [Phytophthora fragariae]|uniref:Uncharacterized protein n=1 Tax=Phytophthora fragariae TaxID=53985 RepID=A0A6A3DF90_9STRA|nr:hypothetical protein PF003_g19216 [Phytophthora fragariae]KAE8917370.1 hypothetical protein PF009_g32308 [Phytophthora fragariae]KAE9054956.1 hypothetical protein PF010_g32325 [Phytophthora fragariae]KAE9156980.1 hypothetical protein PF004_g32399 [Phytophthora fragariae]KAE9262041.1 hypothetical protein PF001_g32196 [Phytophthora fragariae]
MHSPSKVSRSSSKFSGQWRPTTAQLAAVVVVEVVDVVAAGVTEGLSVAETVLSSSSAEASTEVGADVAVSVSCEADASVTVCCCVESSAVVDAEDSVTVCCWVESSATVDAELCVVCCWVESSVVVVRAPDYGMVFAIISYEKINLFIFSDTCTQ